MLFAEMNGGVSCLLFLVFIIGLIAGGIQLWLMVKHPQVWAQLSRQRHERLMAWSEQWHQKRMQEKAARQERNRRAFGVAGTLFRIFLGHHH